MNGNQVKDVTPKTKRNIFDFSFRKYDKSKYMYNEIVHSG